MAKRIGKKPAAMASHEFARMFSQVSKQALIDALWCASQLGTNDTIEEYIANAAKNVEIALRERGDRIPPDIAAAATMSIDA